MVEITTIRPRTGPPRLVPATRDDLNILETVRAEHGLQTAITFARSNQHNRWYHKLCDVVAEAIGVSPDWLKREIKLEVYAFSGVHTSRKFGVVPLLKSTAFAAMDEIEFTAFRERAVEVLFTRFLPGVSRKAVYEEVYDLLGERCPW